ncbi:MAG: Crp/Fnr family transcriptional regulator [Flavobacteriales bacterium]|nr:Crp/Fnr family transcriptional regulator [Flavobacteriales bacterium]
MDSFLKQYCSSEWQEFINFHKIKKVVEPNEYVFKEKEQTEGLYIINKGKVKVISRDVEGKETLIRLASDGDILGHRGFGGDWTYPISAMTYEKSEITFIPINTFNIVAKSNNEFTYQLMMFFAEELRRSEEKIMHVQVKNRVARAILTNYNAFGPDKKDPTRLSYTISRKDYASMVNTTYETVIRVLSDLNKEKIISVEGKSIRILNLDLLNQLAYI